jgi:hypothetical protein
MMTQEGYSSISPGSSVETLLQEYGEPYAIVSMGGDVYQYEYIERWLLGKEVVVQRRYYFTVRDGVITDKKMTSSRPPAYEAIYSDTPIPNYY